MKNMVATSGKDIGLSVGAALIASQLIVVRCGVEDATTLSWSSATVSE